MLRPEFLAVSIKFFASDLEVPRFAGFSVKKVDGKQGMVDKKQSRMNDLVNYQQKTIPYYKSVGIPGKMQLLAEVVMSYTIEKCYSDFVLN